MNQIPASLLLDPSTLDSLHDGRLSLFPDALVLSDWIAENESIAQYGPDNLPDNLRAWLVYHTVCAAINQDLRFGCWGNLTSELGAICNGCGGGWDREIAKPMLHNICEADLVNYSREYGNCIRSLARVLMEGIPMVDAQIAFCCFPHNNTDRVRFDTRLSFLKYTALHLPPLPAGVIQNLLLAGSVPHKLLPWGSWPQP